MLPRKIIEFIDLVIEEKSEKQKNFLIDFLQSEIARQYKGSEENARSSFYQTLVEIHLKLINDKTRLLNGKNTLENVQAAVRSFDLLSISKFMGNDQMNGTSLGIALREYEYNLRCMLPILTEVRRRLLSKKEDIKEKLKSIFYYLETIFINTSRGTRSFREILKEYGGHALLKSQKAAFQWKKGDLRENSFQNPLLQSKSIKDLRSIYYFLMKYYLVFSENKKTWEYDYPISILKNRSTFIPPIHEWCQTLIEPSSHHAAIQDFTRNVDMEGKQEGMSADQIQTLINEKINGLKKYSGEDKQLLTVWLTSNGGQDMNRFADLLLHDGHFIEGKWDIGLSEQLKQYWYVEDDQLFCDCDVLVYVIQQGTQRLLVADLSGKTRIISNLDEVEQFMSNKKKDRSSEPLIRFRATIALDLDIESSGENLQKQNSHRVIPRMTKLHVVSFTDYLQPPIDPFITQEERDKLFYVPRPHGKTLAKKENHYKNKVS